MLNTKEKKKEIWLDGEPVRVGNADELAKKHTRIEHYGDCPKMQHHVQRFPLIHEECVRNGGGGRSAQQLPNIAEDGAAILLVRLKISVTLKSPNPAQRLSKIMEDCVATSSDHRRHLLRSRSFSPRPRGPCHQLCLLLYPWGCASCQDLSPSWAWAPDVERLLQPGDQTDEKCRWQKFMSIMKGDISDSFSRINNAVSLTKLRTWPSGTAEGARRAGSRDRQYRVREGTGKYLVRRWKKD